MTSTTFADITKFIEIHLPLSGKQIIVKSFRDILNIFTFQSEEWLYTPIHLRGKSICPTMRYSEGTNGEGIKGCGELPFLPGTYSPTPQTPLSSYFQLNSNLLTLSSHLPSLISYSLLCISRMCGSCLYFSLYHIALQWSVCIYLLLLSVCLLRVEGAYIPHLYFATVTMPGTS